MTVSIDFWALVGFAASLIAAFVGMARWLASEYDRRQELRFADFRQQVETADAGLSKSLARHLEEEARVIGRIVDHGERLSRVEEAIRRMPGHDDLKRVYTQLGALAEKVDRMQGQIPGIADTLRTLLNHVTHRGG